MRYAFLFHDGQIAARLPFDEEGILIVDIEKQVICRG